MIIRYSKKKIKVWFSVFYEFLRLFEETLKTKSNFIYIVTPQLFNMAAGMLRQNDMTKVILRCENGAERDRNHFKVAKWSRNYFKVIERGRRW